MAYDREKRRDQINQMLAQMGGYYATHDPTSDDIGISNVDLERARRARDAAYLQSGGTTIGTGVGALVGGAPGAMVGGQLGGAVGQAYAPAWEQVRDSWSHGGLGRLGTGIGGLALGMSTGGLSAAGGGWLGDKTRDIWRGNVSGNVRDWMSDNLDPSNLAKSASDIWKANTPW